MLTGSLLDYRRRKNRISPVWLDPAAASPREAARSLIALMQAFVDRPRGELEQALADSAPEGLSTKAAQGLAKLLLDESEFAVAEGHDPLALRSDLFARAAARWRAEGHTDFAGWRDAALADAGGAHGVAPASVPAAMFADLPGEQRLLRVPAWSAEALLYRYNVAQVQGLLLGAERIEIEAGQAAPARLRQLLRYLKFFGLLFRIERDAAQDGLRLVVDGPLSVLEGAKGYGLNLATFFPALLLWPPPWRLRANVRLRGGRAGSRGEGAVPVTHELIVEPHPELRSHFPDSGQWLPDAVKHFVERFGALDTPWQAEAADELIALPGNRYLVPDFRLTHAGAPPVLLEHLLYPSAQSVTEKLALAEQVTGARYVIACRALPSIGDGLRASPALYLYRRQLLAPSFREWLEADTEGTT